jgi:hypothetical protein
MSKGRPFFVINDDDGNPINAKTELAIAQAASSGKQKGDSRSIDPVSGKKFPRGFTPPVDFYTQQQPIVDAKEEGLSNQDKNLNVGRNNSGGKDPNTGRHIEYGQSLTVVNSDGGISINGAGNKTKLDFVQPRSPEGPFSLPPFTVKVNLDNLAPFAFYKDANNLNLENNRPIEYGQRIFTTLTEADNLNQEDRLGLYLDPSLNAQEKGLRYQVYNFYKDYASKRFTHLMDYFIDEKGEYTKPKIKAIVVEENLPKRWIGTSFFTKTYEDNEDPTILAVDLQIKSLSSPLLNGSIDEFLLAFGTTYEEIKSRQKILEEFKAQLKRFIPTDTPIADNSFNSKAYYLQNIKGLEKLVERPGSEGAYFVDYGKDLITLEFLEDVTQNMGYLASLYKALSYSRINGKEIVPSNLLRFDIDINITEMRNYTRHMANPSQPERIMIYADQISKYTYTLYECKFLFDKMPHGEAVSNAKTEILENFELSFDYKFSTMKFTKFSGKITLLPDQNGKVSYYYIDTSKKKIDEGLTYEKGPNKPDIILNKIDSFPRVPTQLAAAQAVQFNPDELPPDPNEEYALAEEEFTAAAPPTDNFDSASLENAGDSERVKEDERKKESDLTKPPSRFQLAANKAFDQIGQGLKRAAINEVNRQIITQAALLNKTIDNIRNSVGLGRMSEPTNVYTGTNAFRNDVLNTLRNALGNSVKSFFDKP